MYKSLILYRNELKNKQIYKYKLIGIVSELLLSKQIFPKNKDIGEFLESIFNLTYKGYIMKSRTILVAKVVRFIYTNDDVDKYNKDLLAFINEQLSIIQNETNMKERKNEFDGWIK